MTPGTWYVQRFSDEHLYFIGNSFLKNGNMAGVQVRHELFRPRAMPKAKKSTVPQTGHYDRLWTAIAESDVPEKVLRAFVESLQP